MSKKFCFRAIALMIFVCLLVLPFSACKDSGNMSSEPVGTAESDAGTESNMPQTSSDTASGESQSSSASQLPPTTIDDSKPKTSLSRDEVIAKMPASLRGTTIKYMYWWNPKEQMEKDAIAAFEKATGIKVEPIVASYEEFTTQLASKVASGDSPDIVRLLGNSTERTSALQPITNSGFDFNDTAWDSQVMKDYTFNGNCYAVNLKNSAIMDYAVIYYNKNALKNAEMEDPYTIWEKNPSEWTWSKFWAMCDEFLKANNNRSGYYGATFEYTEAYVRALGGYGFTYDSSKGKFVSGISNKATEVGWQRTLDAMNKKWLVSSHDVTAFDNGKILFFWSGPFSARTADNRQQALKKTNALGIVPIPTDSKNQTLYEYTAFGIPEGAKNAAAAPYYLRYVLDQSSYDMNKVWYSAEAKTVMDYAASSDNIWYGNSYIPSLESTLKSGGSAQVQSVLASFKNVVDSIVKDENKRITYYD